MTSRVLADMGKVTQPPITLPGGRLVFPPSFKPAVAQSPDIAGSFWRALFGVAIFDPLDWRGDRSGLDSDHE